MQTLKKKTENPARKHMNRPQRDKAMQAPPQAKAAPVKSNTVIDVKSIAAIRVLHGGQAIISCDGDNETVKCSKVQIVIED